MRQLFVLAVTVAWVVAEPPVGRQYLPPGAGRPSMQYGAPSSFGRSSGAGGPSRQYGAPSPSFGRFNGNNGLSTQYGAPARGYNGPSSQYGAPGRASNGPSSSFGRSSGRPSTQYGAPSAGSNGGFGEPSTRYGPPSAFGNSGPSSQYGAPSASNGNAPFGQYSAPSTQYGAPGGGYPGGRGYNSQEDPLAEPANYEFQYEVNDAESGSDFGHEESRQDDTAVGSYNVVLPDGRRQIVEYQADQEGFQSRIRYEDTGRGAGYPRQGNGGYNYPKGQNGGYSQGQINDGPY